MLTKLATTAVIIVAYIIPLANGFIINSYRGSDCHGMAMGEFATQNSDHPVCENFINPEASSVFVTPQPGDEGNWFKIWTSCSQEAVLGESQRGCINIPRGPKGHAVLQVVQGC